MSTDLVVELSRRTLQAAMLLTAPILAMRCL